MNEEQAQVMFSILQAQRNAEADKVVQLVGQMRLLEQKIRALEAQLKAKKGKKTPKK